MKIELKEFQKNFLFSKAQYPAMVSSWATGKSMTGIFRGLQLSEAYPNNLGLIVRKEFVDLRDSTLKDYEKYTGRIVASQNKEDKLSNGSVIMFRHADELDALKNINLGWFWIEQAEELESDEKFFFLRGRLRRQGVGLLTGFITANTNGHNWVWNIWKRPQRKTNGEYPLFEATTQQNADVLPAEYLKNLQDLKLRSPSIYNQYVLNSWEEGTQGRWIIPLQLIESAEKTLVSIVGEKRIITCDPSLGVNETVIYAMMNTRIIGEKILPAGEKDTMKIAGELILMKRKYKASLIIVDSIGIGRGICDRLRELGQKVLDINSAESSKNTSQFLNLRAEMWWNAGQMFLNHKICFGDFRDFNFEILKNQLSQVQYEVVDSSGKIKIEKKELIEKRLGASRDRADAFLMGLYGLQFAPVEKKPKDIYEVEEYTPTGSYMSV